MTSPKCPVCDSSLSSGIKNWHFQCAHCGYESSALEPKIVEQADGGDLDEDAREIALEPLRKRNFSIIRRAIERLARPSAEGTRSRLLDVGCAHGWFIQACSSDHFDVLGIEPDEAVARSAELRIRPIRHGFFPDVLENEEKFDVIVFNDVLEHIPDVKGTLRACGSHLEKNGLLVVNAPSRGGALYRLSKILSLLGMSKSFDRMWQKGFPSPHVHYFDDRSVSKLADAHGFDVLDSHRLPSVSIRGLYSRIRYSKNISPFKAGTVFCVLLATSPLLRILPPDIKVWYLRKRNGVAD